MKTKEQKRQEAHDRKLSYDSKSDKEKLERLEREFPGGAKKEKAKLRKRLNVV